MEKGILVLGASGLIGGYLYDFLKQKGERVIGADIRNGEEIIYFDLTKTSLENLPLDGIGFAVICAAVTKLDVCKENPDYSYLVNVKGMKRIIERLSEKGIVPVFMSSGSVFDGIKGGYKEDGERNPISLYGKQKVEVEDFITNNIKDYLIIRPGKVFGLKKGEGVLFSEWLDKYNKKEKIVCADDEGLSPVYVKDVARGIYELLKRDARGIYNLNPQEHYSRFEMVCDFFKYLGIKDANVVRCSIDDFGFSEKRMKNSFMDASKFIEETGFEFMPLEKIWGRIAKE